MTARTVILRDIFLWEFTVFHTSPFPGVLFYCGVRPEDKISKVQTHTIHLNWLTASQQGAAGFSVSIIWTSAEASRFMSLCVSGYAANNYIETHIGHEEFCVLSSDGSFDFLGDVQLLWFADKWKIKRDTGILACILHTTSAKHALWKIPYKND